MRHQRWPGLQAPPVRGAVAWLALCGALCGCASPGPPKPPSLHLPVAVADLKADRIGDQVELHWTTPARTTDGQAIQGSLTAAICREEGVVRGGKEPVCLPVATAPVAPGPSTAVDRLPSALLRDPVVVLGYKVSVLNAKGRSAGPSQPVYALAGAGPGPVTGLKVTGRATGAEIVWDKGDGEVAVGRRLALDAEGHPPAVKGGAKGETGGHRGESLQVELATDPLPGSASQERTKTAERPKDPGGVEDRDAIHGMLETYEYTAWRFRTVSGPDGHPLVLRGPVSAPVRYTVRDIFPPQVPRGLAAVPGLAGARTVDLSWQPVSDADLAGYLVYRKTGLGGNWTRLSAAPDPATAYRDSNVAAGETYAYRVTAVDQTGNESASSAEVRETPQP